MASAPQRISIQHLMNLKLNTRPDNVRNVWYRITGCDQWYPGQHHDCSLVNGLNHLDEGLLLACNCFGVDFKQDRPEPEEMDYQFDNGLTYVQTEANGYEL